MYRTKQEMMKASQQLTETMQRIRNRMHSETERNFELLTELGTFRN